MLPLLAEWAITLGFYIHLKKRKYNIKKKIKKLINDKKNSIKLFSKERAKQFRKTLKLQEKNYNNNYFEKFLFNVMLYIFPILLKLIVFKNLGFEIVFCLVAVIFYGYDILSEIWCEYTCAPRLRNGWSEQNKTLGQCSINRKCPALILRKK